MSKKDYVKMAAIFKAQLEATDGDISGRIWLKNAIYAIANMFHEDNPRFQYARFIEACGANDNDI